MDALDVISLADAKLNLVVDYPDRDAEITRLIKTSVAAIERYTNVLLYEREREYQLNSCSLNICDYPIEFTDTELKTKSYPLSVTVYGKDGDLVSATVGFDEIPDDYQPLVEACYKYITYCFANKDAYGVTLPLDIQVMVNQFRRSPTF